MKKALAIILTFSVLFVMGGWTFPQDNGSENRFSLISYLETHEISSYEEFIDVIDSFSPETISEEKDTLGEIVYFHIDIDYEDRTVSVTTIEETSYDRSNGASNSASKKYYNDIGALIFTITVSGSFKYSSGSCTATSNGGSFTKPFYSTWSSTPILSKGNINATKAYVRIRGTATNGGSTKTYSLTLTCDTSGNFTSY